ncbi:DUF4489 domain-containing protein [Clostridium thailandense]|uniref:DUF4489 domain-containing protein n=1 Tax=Clostridium thailandense TaxID=2794346 RepID=UPI00398A3B70
MNSISKYYDKANTAQDKNIDCYDNCKHPAPGKALLRCNNGSFGPGLIVFPTPDIPIAVNQPIASVTIDTACLCNPEVLVDFAGILTGTIIDAAIIATLNFTLYKTCKGIAAPIPLTTFTFSYVNVISPFPDSRTLKFEYLSCDNMCVDCCTYTLELTSISNLGVGTISISINGNIFILAVESPK